MAVFATIPNAPIMTGKVVVLRCHILVTSIYKSSYLLGFSKILSDTLVSLGRDINEKTSFIIIIFYDYVWSIYLDCPVSVNVEFP